MILHLILLYPILPFTLTHVTLIIVSLVAWHLNESEARVDLILIEILLIFLCKFLLIISMRIA